jgi:hypothetical protein
VFGLGLGRSEHYLIRFTPPSNPTSLADGGSQLTFQFCDLPTEGRLRDPEPLSSLTYTAFFGNEAEAATRMLSQIASLLRVSLEGPIVAGIFLSQKLDFARKYLAIEEIRLGDRLQVAFDSAPESLEASIPSMLLQPLLENAVLHGVGQLKQGGTIAVQTQAEDHRLRIVIRKRPWYTFDKSSTFRRPDMYTF